ncbi:MAG TPA: DUF378 domain-containing protein [Acidimicrobiia bacterium]|nr:DUF378 domain-containing protein [Acidimicrobiia bacterium]
MNTNLLNKFVTLLLVIGGLNWGIVQLFGTNPVEEIFGTGTGSGVIYVIVGVAALFGLYHLLDDTMHHGTTH